MVACAALLFSLQPLIANALYEDGANAWGTVFLRFLVPALFLVFFVKRKNYFNKLIALILGAVLGGSAAAYYASIQYISSGLAVILLYTYPVIIFVIALALKEDFLSIRKFVAVISAVSGIYISVGVINSSSITGILLALTAAGAFALYLLLSRRLLPDNGGLSMVGWVMLGAVLFLLVPIAFGMTRFPTTLSGYGMGLILSLFSGLIPIAMLTSGSYLMQKDTDTGIILTLEPVGTFLLAWMFLSESLTINTLVGFSMVVAAIVIMVLPQRNRNLLTINSSG